MIWATGWKGSRAEIITQIQPPTAFARKAEVAKQRGQLSQCGQNRPAKQAALDHFRLDKRYCICSGRFLWNIEVNTLLWPDENPFRRPDTLLDAVPSHTS